LTSINIPITATAVWRGEGQQMERIVEKILLKPGMME